MFTGRYLNILISCDNCWHHSWMSYATWYSIYKNLPDAEVTLLAPRKNMNYFKWPKKVGINFSLHKPIDYLKEYQISLCKLPLLVLEPDVMVINEFNLDIAEKVFYINSDEKVFFIGSQKAERVFFDLCGQAKDNKPCSLVSYSGGCGSFVLSEWINKKTCPFGKVSKYNKGFLTSNESKVFQMWKNMASSFGFIN